MATPRPPYMHTFVCTLLFVIFSIKHDFQYQKILNKSIRTMSDMFDEFQQDGWEEIHGDR